MFLQLRACIILENFEFPLIFMNFHDFCESKKSRKFVKIEFQTLNFIFYKSFLFERSSEVNECVVTDRLIENNICQN